MDPVLRVWRRPLRELTAALLDAIMPSACAACGAPGTDLCAVCRRNLRHRPMAGCRRCGEPAPGRELCGRDHRELRHLGFVCAPFRFIGTGGALVRRFKLDGDAAAGRQLAQAMRGAWTGRNVGCWRRARLVPVPLHPSKRRQRGFDQAAWLAHRIGSRLGMTVLPDVLRRVVPTRAQGDPRTLSRTRNVAGAFAVVPAGLLEGRRTVLVDDVFTSGATLRECARLLREAGAIEVAGLVACRS